MENWTRIIPKHKQSHLYSSEQIKIAHYNVYNSKHPNAERHARGGAAVIIRQNLKRHKLLTIEENYMQVASVIIEDLGPLPFLQFTVHLIIHRIKKVSYSSYKVMETDSLLEETTLQNTPAGVRGCHLQEEEGYYTEEFKKCT